MDGNERNGGEMNGLYICNPSITDTSIRLLPKYKRKFTPVKYTTLQNTIKNGIDNYPRGFRLYRQNCYKYYSPSNILLADFRDIRKEVSR
jgi:hypothetical protein